jgi:alpha-glucosidase
MNAKTSFFLIIITFLMSINSLFSKDIEVLSPEGEIRVVIHVNENITWSAFYKDKQIMDKNLISLETDDRVLGLKPVLRRSKTNKINEEYTAVVPTISSTVKDVCNELELTFKKKYKIYFRAYDNGIAYRFETSLRDEIEVVSEKAEIHFPGDFISYFPQEESLISHYERLYLKKKISAIKEKEFCSLPVLFRSDQHINILVTEADLFDYPCLFLEKTAERSFTAKFPKVVLETRPEGGVSDRNQDILKEADYIAKTKGKRTFPWRVFCISDNDNDLLTNDLVFQLSRPLIPEKTDWLKPGKVAWDWWNALNVYGVDFKSGINTKTYKYYIDFASEYGLEYIILDEGWSTSTTDIMGYKPQVNVEEIIKYGDEKGVGIILWVLWKPLDDNLKEVLDLYKKWGVQGIKVDFMQRADQYMVHYYEKVAREAAEREMIVDYHGAFKPAGLRRAYPNVVNYEGLKGLENTKWSKDITPEHDVTLPFIRMVAGPMDYTPGAMDNAHMKNFAARNSRPMSMGTRCHQIAMYVIYESPLQMLCDNPSNYYREKECTEFISKIPTVWDETIVFESKVAEYLALARRNGETWYIGAMTNDTERDINISFSFLQDGDYNIEIIRDGINADRMAQDYEKIEQVISNKDAMKIHLASGGGWAAIISKK